MSRFHDYPDRDMLMLGLADRLAGSLRSALAVKDRVSLSVPGGSTPGPIFDILSSIQLDWARVDVVLNDERWVPESSDRSNTALLRRRLLVDQAAAAHLVPLRSDVPTPEDGLADLLPAVQAILPLDVLLLGMGGDMHTASLFPGADRLAQALAADAPPLMAMRAPGAPEPRITLTAPVLTSAVETHVLITGAEKRAAYQAALGASGPAEAPIKLVLDQADVHWAP